MENEILTIAEQQRQEGMLTNTNKALHQFLIETAATELLQELENIKGLPKSVYASCLNLLNALNK